MKILSQNIYLDPQKVKSYLLNINHPDGGTKAKLLMGLGFDVNDTSILENVIVKHATGNNVSKVIATPFGEKYLIEGSIETPAGRLIQVRSIWIKEFKQEMVKFVTLYPI